MTWLFKELLSSRRWLSMDFANMGRNIELIGKPDHPSGTGVSWDTAYNLITEQFSKPGYWYYTGNRGLALPAKPWEEALYQYVQAWYSLKSQGKQSPIWDFFKRVTGNKAEKNNKEPELTAEDKALIEAYESGTVQNTHKFTETRAEKL